MTISKAIGLAVAVAILAVFSRGSTAMAQQHLRNILAYLDVPALGQPEAFIQAKEGLFEADGSIGAASQNFLQDWLDRYVAWVKRHAG